MLIAEQLNVALAGRYHIDREIGSGGMAIVYHAHDAKHDRSVALKVLKPDLGALLGAVRFLEEIRVTANLQHPNLLPLFDSGVADGLLFYVMPFIEGESLRARLDREKLLPIDDAVHIAASVAGALDYAHAHGVIHRDLKPENILLQGDEPMVADFGIALAVRRAGGERMTGTGISLGTPNYMSPEQATGERVVDGRSDIYSLAAVLYEMLTGDPPHAGSSVQAIIAKVLTEPVSSVRVARPNVPEHVADAIARGLEKLAADRWASAGAFADALTGGKRVSAVDIPRLAPKRRRGLEKRGLLLAGIAFLGGMSLAALGAALSSSPALPLTWLNVVSPDSLSPRFPSGVLGVFGQAVALSADGAALVYVADQAKGLVVRRLDELTLRLLPGTEDAICPRFSPDGRWLIYVARGQLFKMRVSGGTPLALADSAVGCAVWTDQNEVVYNFKEGLYRRSADGGPATELLRRDSKGIREVWPTQALPGGAAVVVEASASGSPFDYQLAVVSIPDGRVTWLTTRESDGDARFNATYSRGYLVFEHGKVIVAAPFSLRSRRITGPEVTLLRDTAYGFVTSPSGNAAYRSVARPRLSLFAVALDGHARPLSGMTDQGSSRTPSAIDTAHYAWPRLSPDGRRIALELNTGTHSWDISVYDLVNRSLFRLTTNFTGIRPAGWTTDGAQLIYFRLDAPTVDSPQHLVNQPWDGSSTPTELFRTPPNANEITFGPPHTYAAIALGGVPAYAGLVLVPLDTPAAARPLLPAQPNEGAPRISPDGKLLAYVGNESQHAEVYLRQLPSGARVQISTSGGTEPAWSRDGKSLFYRGPEHVMHVTITTRPTLTVARRDTLFKDVYERNDVTNYDVFPGSKELLMIRASPVRLQLAVIQNWPELLSQRGVIH